MRRHLLTLAAVATAAAIVAPAAGAAVTATATRIGDHPAHVRVVVDVRGGAIDARTVMATDPSPLPDGRVRIVVPGRDARVQAPPLRRHGVTARVVAGRHRLVVTLAAASGRFTYAGYRVFRGPERLVVDLYKRRPVPSGATARYGRPGCLRFTAVTAGPRRLDLRGTEVGVFEHSFPIFVRSAQGRVVGRRVVAAAEGGWSARVPYRVARPQRGTVEAVELSAKDGALSCLVRAPVVLRP